MMIHLKIVLFALFDNPWFTRGSPQGEGEGEVYSNLPNVA